MTVSVETNKSQLLVYAAGTDQYSWGTFDVPTDADVRVYVFDDSGNGDETLLTLATHYTVDTVNKRIELTATGHTFIAGLSYTNERIAIYRSIDSLTQSSEYTNQGAFLSQSIEDSFDQVYYILQEHGEILKRSIQIDAFDTVVDGYATEEEQRQAVTLPSLDGVTNGIVYFDSTLKQFAISDNVAFTNLSTVATNISDVNTVAADLNGDDTIGVVAADLTGSDTIGDASALVLAGSPGLPFVRGAGDVILATFGTGLSLNTTTGELSLDADLDAVSGLTGTGFLARTGTNSWALRNMTATADRGLTIAEPAGVSGNTVFTLAQDIRMSASPSFAGGTFTGDIEVNGVTTSPSGATVGQALGFPNSPTVLEPYTPAGAGDLLAAANETVTGDYSFEGDLDWKGQPPSIGFASRSAFVTWAGSNSVPDGTVVSDGKVLYVASSGATDISDLSGWLPSGIITPNHFGENTAPGTTDMAAAIQAAIDYAGSFVTSETADQLKETSAKAVHFLDEEYRVDSTVTIAKEYSFLKLFGSTKSSIESSSTASPVLRINDSNNLYNGGDANGLTTMNGVWIDGLRFRCRAVNNQTTIGVQVGRVSDFRLTNCYFHDYWVHLDGYRIGSSLISGNRFQSSSRVNTAPGLAQIRLRPVGGTENANKPGGGIHCTDNEFIGSTTFPDAMENAILIEAVDGFYFTQNHFNAFNTSHIQIAPDSTSNAPVIADVRSGGANYFDGDNSNGCVHVLVSGDAQGTYQAVVLDGDYLRGGNTCDYGVFVSVDNGNGNIVANSGGIRYCEVKNCTLVQHREQGIKIEGEATSHIPLVRPRIVNNTFSDGGRPATGLTSYVDIDAKGILFSGNELGPEDNAPTRAAVFRVADYTGVSVSIINNDFLRSTYSTEPYFIDAGTGNTFTIFGNVYADGADGFRIGDDNEVAIDEILDEDDMASNSATALATQQSIRNYVQDNKGALGALAGRMVDNNTNGAITVSGNRFVQVAAIDPATSASLATISDGNSGDLLVLACAPGDTITVNETDNIRLGATTRVLNGTHDKLMLICIGSFWHELAYADNN